MVFLTTQANTYTIMAATEEYLAGGPLYTGNSSDILRKIAAYDTLITTAETFRERIQKKGTFQKLSARDCLQAYSTQYVSTNGDLLLVQNAVGAEYYLGETASTGYAASDGLLYVSFPTTYPSYSWACPLGSQIPCNPQNKTETPSPDLWKPYGDIVQYCWSEKVKENCKVGFNMYFAIIVVTCNLVKVIGMFMTFKTHRQGALITLGDALESFLDKGDVTTSGIYIYSTDRMRYLWSWKNEIPHWATGLIPTREKLLREMQSKQWVSKRWYWGSAATGRRWICCFVL